MKTKISIIAVLLLLALTGSVILIRMGIVPAIIQPTERDHFSAPAEIYPSANWRLILVNQSYSIPQNYTPELTQLSNGIYVDSRIYPDLQRMFDDARAEGVDPIVGEGYRSHQAQERMMNDRIESYLAQGYAEKEAQELAQEWVAIPGTSEHELGIALDINAAGDSTSDEVYTWLADNAYKYGFILRYPQGKENITGIAYEPWHYRYVGTEAALAIYQQQITLEEYLASGK